jgi:hypothetical protein
MKNTLARFSTHTLLLCGLAALGFQLPAQAQSLTTTSIPSTVVGSARNGAAFTIQVTNNGPAEAFGVVLKFTTPKGSKIAFPKNCFVVSSSTGAIQCMMGYIAPSAYQQINFKITTTRAGAYNTSFSAICTAAACSGGQLTVPISLN